MSSKAPLTPAKRWIRNDVIFAGLTLLLVALTYTPVAAPLNDPLCALSFSGTDWLLSHLGVAHTVDPSARLITGEAFSIEISGLCSGLRALALFFAVIALLRLPRRKKAIHLAVGAALLVTVNVARIAHLYTLGEARSPSFNLYHEWIWPTAIVAVILLYRLVMLIATRTRAAAERAREAEVAHG